MNNKKLGCKNKFITVDFFIQATLLGLIVLSGITGSLASSADYLRFLPFWLIYLLLFSPYQFLISNTIRFFFIKKSCESRLEKVVGFFRDSVLVLSYIGYFLVLSKVIDEPPWLWLKSFFDNGLTLGSMKVRVHDITAEQCMWNLYYSSIPISVIYFFLTCFEFFRSNDANKSASTKSAINT